MIDTAVERCFERSPRGRGSSRSSEPARHMVRAIPRGWGGHHFRFPRSVRFRTIPAKAESHRPGTRSGSLVSGKPLFAGILTTTSVLQPISPPRVWPVIGSSNPHGHGEATSGSGSLTDRCEQSPRERGGVPRHRSDLLIPSDPYGCREVEHLRRSLDPKAERSPRAWGVLLVGGGAALAFEQPPRRRGGSRVARARPTGSERSPRVWGGCERMRIRGRRLRTIPRERGGVPQHCSDLLIPSNPPPHVGTFPEHYPSGADVYEQSPGLRGG